MKEIVGDYVFGSILSASMWCYCFLLPLELPFLSNLISEAVEDDLSNELQAVNPDPPVFHWDWISSSF